MSEFDVINGKLDRLLAIATRGEVAPPETPVPMPHPEAPAPVPYPQQTPTMTDLLFPRNPILGRSNDNSPSFGPLQPAEPVPSVWEHRRFLCQCYATTYTISGPPGNGFMVTGGDGGYDAMFNGVVGACTIRFDASGTTTLTVSKQCLAYLDPL